MTRLNKKLITGILVLFLSGSIITYAQTQPQTIIPENNPNLNTSSRVTLLAKTLADSMTNFDFWHEYFFNTNIDVYKGSRYTNNYCNLQQKFYLISEKQDIYDKIVNNAFRYSKEKLLQLQVEQSNLTLEVEFLRNVDVYTETPYGDYKNKAGEIKNDFNQKSEDMLKELEDTYKDLFNVNVLTTTDRDILRVKINSYVEKYKEYFNFYEFDAANNNYKARDGRYFKDECLGGIAQINAKVKSLQSNWESLKKLSKTSIPKEFNKLMNTIDKFLKTAKSAATPSFYKEKLAKIYGFDPKKEYSFVDSLKQIARKTFPGAEDQLDKINDQYINRSFEGDTLDRQITAKLTDGVSEESKTQYSFDQYLNADIDPLEKYFIMTSLESQQLKATQKEADDLVKFTKTEVQDVNVLSLISILEKTTIQAREMNAICGVKEDASSNEKSSWLYSSKRVHTKQCE